MSEVKKSKVVKVVDVTSDGKLLVNVEPITLLDNMGLGFHNKNIGLYVLDIAELAYIIYKSIATVLDRDGDKLGLMNLFIRYSRSAVDWIKFTVLLDLRDRGRKARAGYYKNSLIYSRGNSKIMVFVTEENAPLKAALLVEWVSSALSKGYEPVLAVVDAHGDVTYYSMFPVRVNELGGSE